VAKVLGVDRSTFGKWDIHISNAAVDRWRKVRDVPADFPPTSCPWYTKLQVAARAGGMYDKQAKERQPVRAVSVPRPSGGSTQILRITLP
jgi:hypothetical protein